MEILNHNNQQLIWNAFMNLPNCEQIYDKRKIFHNVISKYYEKYGTNSIEINSLAKINRDIMNDLFSEINNEISKKNDLNVNTNTYNPIVTQQKFYVESEQEKTSRIFKEKQEQYDNMMKKPQVQMPSELESEHDDGAITNMDELIKQYEMQRKEEIPTYNPKIVDSSNNDALNTDKNNNNVEISEIKIEIKSILIRLTELENTLKTFSKKNNEL